jgi:uncharacterized membrane protein YcaP (DUF421 family)
VTIKPLVNGTISIIQGMKSQSADNYKEAPARVTQLIDDGFRIKSPSEEQLTAFHEKVSEKGIHNLDNVVICKYHLIKINKITIN